MSHWWHHKDNRGETSIFGRDAASLSFPDSLLLCFSFILHFPPPISGFHQPCCLSLHYFPHYCCPTTCLTAYVSYHDIQATLTDNKHHYAQPRHILTKLTSGRKKQGFKAKANYLRSRKKRESFFGGKRG